MNAYFSARARIVGRCIAVLACCFAGVTAVLGQQTSSAAPRTINLREAVELADQFTKASTA